jgi:hypothetical protein
MFEHYFSLEEAARLVPTVRNMLIEAYSELQDLQDDLILYKRLQKSRLKAVKKVKLPPEIPPNPEPEKIADATEDSIFQEKQAKFEACYQKWLLRLSEHKIVINDFEKGLIDFPYRAASGEEFLLCWLFGEEGLFYFHDLNEGFAGRQPISLLPE